MPQSSKPRLIFHIGQHKTGSTSIQDAFATHRITVPGRRILYPAQMNHNYLRPQFDAAAQGNAPSHGRSGQPGIAEIATMMRTGDYDDVVISAEEFEGADPSGVETVLRQHLMPYADDLSVICYIRPHAGRLLSNYAEDLKIGRFDGSLGQYHRRLLLRGTLRYSNRVPQWGSCFGTRFHLRIMAPGELYRDSVLDDFVHVAFGADAGNAVIAEGRSSNESLGLEDLAMLRLFHRQFVGQEYMLHHSFGWEIARLLGEVGIAAPRTRLTMHRALAERVLHSYGEDARRMDKLYCPNGPVFLPALEKNVEAAPRDEQSTMPEDHFPAEVLREMTAISDLAREMIENRTGRWKSFFEVDKPGLGERGPGTAGTLESVLAKALAGRPPALSQAVCDRVQMRLSACPVSLAEGPQDGHCRAMTVLARLIDGMLDYRGGSWRNFLLQRRLRALHGGQPDLSGVMLATMSDSRDGGDPALLRTKPEVAGPLVQTERKSMLRQGFPFQSLARNLGKVLRHPGQQRVSPERPEKGVTDKAEITPPFNSEQRWKQAVARPSVLPPSTPDMIHVAPLARFMKTLPASGQGKATGIPKIIWLFWHSGFDDAPDVVRRSLQTWRHFNPDHEVRALSFDELGRFLDLDLEAVFNKASVNLTWTAKSDLIRLLLLARYGGVWADATTFCLKPLSEWLYDETDESGFFSFRDVRPERNHELVSWFMAAAPGHPVIRQVLLDSAEFLFRKRGKALPVVGFRDYRETYGLRDGDLPGREFLRDCEEKHGSYPYFWMFYLFRDAIREVPGERESWIRKSNLFAQDKHDMKRFARSVVAKLSYKGKYLQSRFYKDRVTALFDDEGEIRSDYRVSEWKGPHAPYAWHNLRRSLQISEARKLIFIHIPKCGGTSVDSSPIFEDGIRRFGHAPFQRYREILGPRISDFRVMTMVRNPWDRLGSAFFYATQEAVKSNNADSKGARDLKREFGLDFDRFLTAFVENPDRFFSIVWLKPSVWFFDPRNCEIPYFIQKLENIADLGPWREFSGLSGFSIPHHRKGPMRDRKKSAFDQHLFDAVGRIYKDDVEAFGYHDTKMDDLSY